METRTTDVVIIGAGSVGSMAAWQLAARGVKVIGLDRFSIPGSFSAYAGESRIFRTVYIEGGHYTPLLRRAQELWRRLESESGVDLLQKDGAVTIVGHGHPDLRALERASSDYALQHEILTGDAARARFPGHVIEDTDTVFFDPEGGYVRPEKAVIEALKAASRNGATWLGNRKVLAIEPAGSRWRVRTAQEAVVADKVIVSAGTGAGGIATALGTHLSVLPQVLTWFPMKTPGSGAYSGDGAPVFMRRSNDAQFYGFPSSDGWTVKVAASVYLEEVAGMERPLSYDPGHLETIRSWVRTYLPDLHPDPIRTAVCADGYTVDHTGLLGEVPGMPGVIAALGFSGHGFKMASSLGAVAAELAWDGSSATDVSFMDPGRFLPAGRTLSTLEFA